ncbi:10301_t:CDS:2 [Paraglomus brasilianum]|uniref:10301_t:CDS:1 n=1 Tax=Paraglomus brasilianum TaxID=144538 RepID=A0A9N9G8A3_9GLOM|nr:10301_t:CDS:2 [Paraglomus brasilianum]
MNDQNSDFNSSFPVTTRQSARVINGDHTEVLVLGFIDKILVIISQYGSIGSLIYATLEKSPTDLALSPTTTSTSLLGIYPTLYQLYVNEIAQLIRNENQDEQRGIVVGLALKERAENEGKLGDTEVFESAMEMIKECKVW